MSASKKETIFFIFIHLIMLFGVSEVLDVRFAQKVPKICCFSHSSSSSVMEKLSMQLTMK